MKLDKNLGYIYRIGSDNQHRIHWNGAAWRYELLAGGVLFDEQIFDSDQDLLEGLAIHGLTLSQFQVDSSQSGENYSMDVQKKSKEFKDAGVEPCPKHGLSAKNSDNSCEACENFDYPDDFKGTEG